MCVTSFTDFVDEENYLALFGKLCFLSIFWLTLIFKKFHINFIIKKNYFKILFCWQLSIIVFDFDSWRYDPR